MHLRSLDQWLMPGLGAFAGGIIARLAGQEPLLIILAGSVGAIAGSLLFTRDRAFVADTPEQTGERRAPADQATSLLAPGQGRALLDSLPMGVILIDRIGTIAYANDHLVDLFGIDGLTAQPIGALRNPALVEAIDRSISDRAPDTVDFNLSHNRDVHLRAHLNPLDDAGETGGRSNVLILVEDVTQVFRSVALHRDFVANASHELKTPLSSIAGIIETLLGHARDDPEASARFLTLMATQTDRMKRLVEDLLSLNRIELNERIAPRELQPVHRIVREVIDSLASTAEENEMTIDVLLPEDRDVEVPGNRGELAQMFRNLIENAIKYGRAGSAVSVRTMADDPDHPEKVGIAISDHGPGIAREHLPRLTERFYRVSVSRSRERGGTGLGLAIVKHILNRHRGELGIESVVGEGSTFTVWLPVGTGREAMVNLSSGLAEPGDRAEDASVQKAPGTAADAV